MNNRKGDDMDGQLRIQIVNALGEPVPDAKIVISFTGEPNQTVEEMTTDASGNTQILTLDTPPLEYSMEPSEMQPYSQYTMEVTAEGYQPINVSGIEVFQGQVSVQRTVLSQEDALRETPDNIVIPANTLYGNYPEKIPEAEIKPITETGEIVLSRVVIPEFVIVHDGAPTDTTAKNYYVRYRDYIKNVASSEIYATWPDAAIRANVLAILSFTMNRVYTEWYRGKGYNFTITSSTAFDHKFVYGRNTYESINKVVDEMFENYLSRPGVKQPLFTQYCDGQKVQCPNWMTQWGSKYLADQGYSAIRILRNYYGSSIYINTADEISGIPSSWPGNDLSVGSVGTKVRQMQEELNVISRSFPAIPKVVAVFMEKIQRRQWKPSSQFLDYRELVWWIFVPGLRYPIFMWASVRLQIKYRVRKGLKGISLSP